uniref:Uncharacterized protein n=1 Tax=Melopsittacus undulatus TaxID=13146 RepID=A0A8C6JWC6_MELUD
LGSSGSQRARWERKRSRTAKELLETEHRYLEQLDLVVTVSILVLFDTWVPSGSMYLFVLSWESVLALHLERGNLGSGLENFCQNLELYGHYTENLEQANKTLKEQLRKNKSFRRFKKLQEARPQFQGRRLEDLLSLPLQRLHHNMYSLVITSEYAAIISEAVKSVSEVSQWVQDIIHKRENSLQLLRIQKLLKGRKIQILTPGRWYIREGWLLVVPSKGEELKRRMFFLFSDIFISTKPCHPLHPLNSNKLACQAVYPLHQCVVEKVFGHTQSQGGLLSLSFPHKTLLLMSSDQQDINDWYQSLWLKSYLSDSHQSQRKVNLLNYLK